MAEATQGSVSGSRRACNRHSGQELGSRPGPCQRLAGCAGAGLSRLERGEAALAPDHSQPRLSGAAPANGGAGKIVAV